jgi:hypothetical protein
VATQLTDQAITFINNADLGWKADTCKLTKDHPDRGSHCDQENVQLEDDTLLQTDSDLEKKKKFGSDNSEFKKVLKKAQHWANSFNSATEIPDDKLPTDLDWSNVEGYNFMGDFRDQGPCGSCYTVSFTQVVESRLKLKYGKEVDQLSP